jgi:hypothetical protein
MDNLHSNLTRISTYVVSIARYHEHLVSLDELTFWYVPLKRSRFLAFLKIIVSLMDPFDIQIHISCYRAIDTRHVRILVKFECRLFISVLRNKTFFTKKKRWAMPLENVLCHFFFLKLNGQLALKFDKKMDVRRIYCMILRTPGFLRWVHFFGTYHSNRLFFWSLLYCS